MCLYHWEGMSFAQKRVFWQAHNLVEIEINSENIHDMKTDDLLKERVTENARLCLISRVLLLCA